MGAIRVSGGLGQVEEKAPPDPHPAASGSVLRYSGVGVELHRIQMRGLGTISAPRHNGRGPDSSLKWQLIFV